MRHFRLFLLALLFSAMFALAYSFLSPRPIWAANPPTDTPCRGCHDETTRHFTFPSGESVPLRVELAGIDGSAHSSLAEEAVACSGCHVNETRYRYPHAEQPAQSQGDFIAAIEQSCQDCHYPHTPFHESPVDEVGAATSVTTSLVTTASVVADADAALAQPSCVDCHGGHDIAKAGSITTSVSSVTNTVVQAGLSVMAENCLRCHSDQTVEWLAQYIAPRPGLGAGAEGYIGSARCASCHEETYFSWQKTLHAHMVQSPAQNPQAIVADFNLEDSDRTFAQSDVLYTIGSVWKQLYLSENLSQTGVSKLALLPAQWNVESKEWVAYQHDTGEGIAWLENCGSCHVTGLETEQWSFREFNVGCESCHGPGEEHANAPEENKLFDKQDDQVCGACHSRGASPEGFPFPANYRPGDTLSEHFTLETGEDVRWPDGSAKLHNQQYADWHSDNRMVNSGKVTCTTCHAVHDPGVASRQLLKPLNELCTQCHDEQAALVAHVPFHEQAITQARHAFTCADCHMPKLASSAVGMDIRLHTFTQPDAQQSIDHGGLSAMPNACNRCHQDLGEDPEWAAQTIAFSKELKASKPKSFFGPGPTPTSPPPPTPIAVVGQPAILDPPGPSPWMRPVLVTGFWTVVVLFLVWIVNLIRVRRMKNA